MTIGRNPTCCTSKKKDTLSGQIWALNNNTYQTVDSKDTLKYLISL